MSDSTWVTSALNFLYAERGWLFSGLGLTLLASLCFVFRWILSLVSTDDDLEHAENLEAFMRQVDNRFEILTAWIQLLHKQYVTENKQRPIGFHEPEPEPFLHPQDMARQSKPNLKDLGVLSPGVDMWSEVSDQMKAIDLSSDAAKRRHARVTRVKTTLLGLGLVFAVSALVVVSLAFL